MLTDGRLDPGQMKRQFDADGFFRIERLLEEQQLQQIENELEGYIRDIAPNVPASDIVYERDGRAVRNLWRMEEHSEFFVICRGLWALRGLGRW